MKTKKIGELERIESLSAGAHIVVEEDGAAKRIPAENVIPQGVVKSVNGNTPDENGNAEIEIPQGTVTSVNGNAPDETGNVEIAIPTDVVKQVNGNAPDENGNVEIEIPEGFSGDYNDLTNKPEIPEGLPASPAPHQQLVTDGEGVAVWEEKPFGEAQESRVIYPESQETHLDYINAMYGTAYQLWSFAYRTPGVPVTVIYDGETYEFDEGFSRLPYYSDDPDNYGMSKHHVGNPALCPYIADGYGLSDNGLAFCVYVESAGLLEFYFADEGTHTIEVREKITVITPLPSKFLPTSVPVIQTAQVGQTVVVKAVDSEGKPTEWEAADQFSGSWEDLEGKPFYVETNDAIESYEDYTFTEWVSYGTHKGNYARIVGVYEDDLYPNIIIWGGVEYPLIHRYTNDEGNVAVLGNTSLFLGVNTAYSLNDMERVDTGEPFCVLIQDGRGRELDTTPDVYTQSFDIIRRDETLHPLDPKYIVLTSPNGTKFNLSVADDGTLSATAAT